jgi:hypothetical protein
VFPAWPADIHREAVLRLVEAATIVADDARKGAGTLAIANGPGMSQRACRDFFQDLVSLSNLELLPNANEVAVRWRGRQEVRVIVRDDGLHTVLARKNASWPLCTGRRAELADTANDTRARDGAATVFPLDLRSAPSAVPLSPPDPSSPGGRLPGGK